MDFDGISIWSPLELSLRVAGTATLVSFVAATLMAWALARKKGPMPALLDALCSLPLVLIGAAQTRSPHYGDQVVERRGDRRQRRQREDEDGGGAAERRA